MNLIISPHLDDEVLGCASFLDKDAIVVYVTQFHPLFPHGENIKENKILVKSMGIKALYIDEAMNLTNELELLLINKLINHFESIINPLKPDTVLIPNPSYNQDHRIVYDAALTAMRPHDRNHFVKRVLLYEQPETWGTLRKPEPFNPTYFRHLDIENKLRLISYYQTQARGHRRDDYIISIAKVRGMQANLDYAEAFEVARWVE